MAKGVEGGRGTRERRREGGSERGKMEGGREERKVCMCRSADDTRDARWISLTSLTMKA